ncbi:hypothetical protein BHM03_00007301 [Ensete ventricosum]|nr:hypothetical protein BHM03_00007301 [Ensete ventricosum]
MLGIARYFNIPCVGMLDTVQYSLVCTILIADRSAGMVRDCELWFLILYQRFSCLLSVRGPPATGRFRQKLTVGGRLKGEIDRRRSIEQEKGKKKKRKRRKKEKKEYLAPVRHRRPWVAGVFSPARFSPFFSLFFFLARLISPEISRRRSKSIITARQRPAVMVEIDRYLPKAVGDNRNRPFPPDSGR